jgi:very-short-patch-repair endonuclease
MSIPARPIHAIARARALRKGNNPAEGAMWNLLKAHRLGGHKFVRQYPIGPFIADFCQRTVRLVIELDGSQHVDSERDRQRDAFMSVNGYSVLRFWSQAVLRNPAGVCDTILAALEGRYVEDIVAYDLRFVRSIKS